MLTKKENLDAIEKFSKDLEVEGRSLWQDARIRFMRNKAAMVSLAILFVMTMAVIFLPMFAPFTYDDTDWYAMHVGPNAEHWFGTDSLRRAIYVRPLIGDRISLMVGVLGALVAVTIRPLYGAASGFIGGKTERVM